MKTKIYLTFALFLTVNFLNAKTVTVEAKSNDISDNLDLVAVANLFGQINNLEEFERELNDSRNQLSNLDLNRDGEVDYLRVVEETRSNTHFILIQAVLAMDIYQDVATVLVEKDLSRRVATVQIIGDDYLYGANYVIEPVYLYTPLIYSSFWLGYYRPWHSPYYWGYYPHYYLRPHCVSTHIYLSYVYNYNRRHHCSYRYAARPLTIYTTIKPAYSRRDYAVRYPQRSFSVRNQSYSVANSRELRSSRAVSTRAATSSTVTSRSVVKPSSTPRATSSGVTTRSATSTSSRSVSGRSATSSTTTRSVSTPSSSRTTTTTAPRSVNSSSPSRTTTTAQRSTTSTSRSVTSSPSRSSSSSAGVSRSSGGSSSSRSSSASRSVNGGGGRR